MQKLTGQSLVKKFEDFGWSDPTKKESRDEFIISCGYILKDEEGKIKPDGLAFTQALHYAKFGPPKTQNEIDKPSKIKNDIKKTSKGKKTNITISGTGIMICKFEITFEDFKKIKSKLNCGELDYDELEIGWDEGDTVAPYFEPAITINGKDINSPKSLESLGCKFNKSEENITQKGSFFTICIENYKGIWGKLELPAEHEFDISKLEVNRNLINIGSGEKMEKFEVANISYMNDEYGELSNHSLEGKSEEWFLIDDQGEVTSL